MGGSKVIEKKSDKTSIEEDVQYLSSIFSEADPNYLWECLEERKHDPKRRLAVSNLLIEKPGYPKRKQLEEKEKKLEKLKQVRESALQFDIESYLANPMNYYDQTKKVNDSYKAHALVYTLNAFPWTPLPFLRQMLLDHNEHLVPTVRYLENDLGLIQILSTETKKGQKKYYDGKGKKLPFKRMKFRRKRITLSSNSR